MRWKSPLLIRASILLLLLIPGGASPLAAQERASAKALAAEGTDAALECRAPIAESAYIPVDSWVYPAMMRLYGMGYASKIYLGLRPWTRASMRHMLEDTADQIKDADLYGDPAAGEAQEIYAALRRELRLDGDGSCQSVKAEAGIESSYSVLRAISGTPLHDSFHLGSTIINDYGRPFENGFSNYSGISGHASAGPFLVYARGEFQGAQAAAGYSTALAGTLSDIDTVPFLNPVTGLPYGQESVPLGPISMVTQGRFLEAYATVRLFDNLVSFGKQDDWLGPAAGGGMAYSNNAENIYSFRINRIEPLNIPFLSRFTGPFRYDFLVGKLRGHTYEPNPTYVANPSPNVHNVLSPGDPWVHVEKFSFKPTQDLEFGWERTVIWGGKGHGPITLHSFLNSFLNTSSTYDAVKYTRNDPGARFGAFDFTYRLPFPRNWLTLYTDSEAHDAPSPIAKPFHGCFRPGLYLSHVPRIPKLDVRFEAVDTDSSYPSSLDGRYQYWEDIQVEGYTNNGQIFGDWIGREGKGGQAWTTYHLSGNEWIQLEMRHQKNSKDFIPGGTTLNDISFQVVKRLGNDLEIKGDFTYERYKAPIYLPGMQNVTATTVQVTWFPTRRVSF